MNSAQTLMLISLLFGFQKFEDTDAYNCKKDSISATVGCECNEAGYCYPGTVPIDPWMAFALKTQRDIQIDEPLDHLQIFDAHNAYNNRASGYGEHDSCVWPPPYDSNCTNVANQEFSFTDMLNLGVRGLEIDNWFCYDAMRMAHCSSEAALSCFPNSRTFRDGLKEISEWLSHDGNQYEIVRIYLNEKYNQSHDDEMNESIEDYLGDRVLTPADLRYIYKDIWPTARQMIKDGKTVVFATGSTAGSGLLYTHGDLFIHPLYWKDVKRKYFTDYPNCGGKNKTNTLRFYSDSTHIGLISDGPSQVGTTQDLTEFVKCRIQFPAVDPITPYVMETAVFTWAIGQPDMPLTEGTCVLLNTTIGRWFTAVDCSVDIRYACQSITDNDEFVISDGAGPYDEGFSACKSGYTYSLPQNGYRQQKVIEATLGSHENVWINYSPWMLSVTTPSSIASQQQYSLVVYICVMILCMCFLYYN